MKIIYNFKDFNYIIFIKLIVVVVLVLFFVCRSDFWYLSLWIFVRLCLEIGFIFGIIFIYYVLWGVLWKFIVLLLESVVVFLLLFNVVMLFYGSSWICWILVFVGVSFFIWLMLI